MRCLRSTTFVEVRDSDILSEPFESFVMRLTWCRLVFNLAQARGKTVMDVDYVMRRNAVDFGVPLFMEPQVSHVLGDSYP